MSDAPTPTTLEGITQVWVRSARNGDAGDFARLYEHIAPAVHTWAALRLRPDQAANNGSLQNGEQRFPSSSLQCWVSGSCSYMATAR